MNIDNRFEIGQVVYHRADSEGDKGIVIGIVVREAGLAYDVSFGVEMDTVCQECELTDSPYQKDEDD